MKRFLARCFSTAPTSASAKTALYEFHVANGGKMVPFAGWSMPVQYSDQSVVESHLHTRKHVSLFDVSHMLQTKIYGADRYKFIESLIPADVMGLQDDSGTLSVFTNDHGGIRDDLIVTKTSHDHLYVVTNAGCIDKDVEHLKSNAENCKRKGFDIAIEHLHGRALVAVQGPEMERLLHDDVSFDLRKLYFMHSALGTVFGIKDCRVTRCGYTGEDGVEISVDPKRAAELCEKLLQSSKVKVKLAGLGARDSLRLEAGLCLYGNDIDENTTPVEAGLAWLIAKRRRSIGGYPGAEIIGQQLKDKNSVKKRRVGLMAEPGKVARAGALVFTGDGSKEIGRVTSGCPSPSLKKNISMAYLDSSSTQEGTTLKLDTNCGKGKPHFVESKITKMPFVPSHYYSPPKTTK